MANELSIMRPENVQMVAQGAPRIYSDNSQRSMRCNEYGKTLLSEIEAGGMNDDLDQRCAAYIEKSRKTVRLMNEQRSPITKMFDLFRAEFTRMEGSIDPTKFGSIPYRIQAYRNEYAARKREEEERRRAEELRRIQHEQAVSKYEADVKEDFGLQFARFITDNINKLTGLNTSLTLENFDAVSAQIKAFATTLPDDLFAHLRLSVLIPPILTSEEAEHIRSGVQKSLLKPFRDRYASEISDYKDSITDALSSKRHELERMAKANAEEQERMKQELAAKEAAEAARLEAERKRKAEEARSAQQMQQQAQNMGDLFNMASVSTPSYTPKTSVKKRVVALDAEGILAIVSFWWSKEGQHMSVEDLTKMFRRQFTAVDKYANDKANAEFIKNEHVKYVDDVKAK